MIPVSSLLSGNYNDYVKLFIEIPHLTYQTGLYKTPKGKYLRAFHKGDWGKLPQRYEEIFAYAQTHSLKLYNYSYEMGINENVVDRIEDYIIQIEIPIDG